MEDAEAPYRTTGWRVRLRFVLLAGRPMPMTDALERILGEATDWLLRMQENPGDRENRAQLEQWLSADRRHAEMWRELNRTYAIIGQADTRESASVAPPPRRRRSARGMERDRRPRRINGRGAVALAASFAALAVMVGPAAWIAIRSDYRTGVGELRTVLLADGSTVELGPMSAVRLDYAQKERRVELLAGQAFFQARHDAARPFRVAAGDVTTTVLGTGFEVRRLPADTEVSVEHGRVRVDSAATASGPAFLNAGDHVAVSEAGRMRRDHGSPLLVAAWAHGEVNARDRTVAQVVEEIRPWYWGHIMIANDAIAARRVNGVFNPTDPARAVRSMVAPLGGSVTQITPWLLIISDR